MRSKPLLAMALVGTIILLQGLYIPAKALLAQSLLNHAWLQTKQGKVAAKPWPWADTYPLAKLMIPKLNKDFIVLKGSTGATLAFAPGHLTGTAMPDEDGHIVLSAHRDTHFSRLGEMHVGDMLQLETQTGEIRKFIIQETLIINSQVDSLWVDHSRNHLTLITCYPFDAIQAGGPLRFRIDAIAYSD